MRNIRKEYGMPKENKGQTEGRRSRKDGTGPLLIPDGAAALRLSRLRTAWDSTVLVLRGAATADKQASSCVLQERCCVFSALNQASKGTLTETLRHMLSSSLDSLYLTSLFLQGFLQIPINLAAIISCYEGTDTEGNLWFGGKRKEFMKLKNIVWLHKTWGCKFSNVLNVE